LDWKERIVVDPAIQGGHAVIKGTRVPVVVILGGLAGGDSIQDICEGYLIAEDDVRAALAYATDLVAQERLNAVRSG